MKEELTELGFRHFWNKDYRLDLKNHALEAQTDTNNIYLIRNGQKMFLMKYDLRRLEAVIKLLK